VEARNEGHGKAASFANTNAANNSAALEARTNGNGNAVEARNEGHGKAASFANTNAANNSAALEARTNGSGNAVEARNEGHGKAASFANTNAANNSAALEVSTAGSGPAAVFDGKVGIGTTSPGEQLTVGGVIESSSGGFKFPDGTVQASAAAAATNVWGLSGNSGTNPATDFLGTSDNQALELKVNGARALRIEPYATSPNIIGGFSGNNVSAGEFGATIAGGGMSSYPNNVIARWGTVSGGYGNITGDRYATIGGGAINTASADGATVSGGGRNTSSGSGATVGGGMNNQASGNYGNVDGGQSNQASSSYTTVGGGSGNIAGGMYATISGGQSNQASGLSATIPGGIGNQAAGDYSFAAGRRATINNDHHGTFLWSDHTDADFNSTASDQFRIRATNGVDIQAGGLIVGSPTGGHLGGGTINAEAVYDDNTMLSDYVFDWYFDGKVKEEDKALHGNYRMKSLEETIAFMEKERHLPTIIGREEWNKQGKSSLGELVNQLWETIETQTIYIKELKERIDELETSMQKIEVLTTTKR
jgi:hypothetical protein